MDKNEYYKQLIALYESADKKENLNEMGEVVNQSQIADTGSDLNQQEVPVDNSGMDQQMVGEDPNMPMDPGMMDPNMQAPVVDSSQLIEKQKFVKLYELFENLLDYSSAFEETLDTIDINLLPINRLTLTKNYKENIGALNEKISNYMIKIFNNEEYEKVLYAYIVFRTELITNVKGLRDILILNKPGEPLPESAENGKKEKN